jgi:DNA-binding Lrp family transcriptional regulator
MDKKDKKILYQLDLDSRQPINKIAKKVGLSKDIVNYRIKKLESNHYILGYQTIIDFQKIGHLTIRTRLTLENTTEQTEKEIIDFLKKQKQVFFILELQGTELTFGLTTEDITELQTFYDKLELKFKEFITNKKFAIYSELYHFNRGYLENSKEKNTIILTKSNVEKIDELDLQILKFLSKNARTTTLEIATKLKSPATTIAHRIKKLEQKKIILGYRLLFNFNKINYNYFRVNIKLKDISKIKKIIQSAESNPNIIYAMRTVGGADLELYFESTQEEMISIVNQLRNTFPEIKTWNYDTLKKYHKFNYFIE